MKINYKYLAGLLILFFAITEIALAAHIGNRTIKRIRNFSPNYLVVWLDGNITNPPACATVLNKIVVNGTDSEWGKQRLSMLMTAMAAGYKVNPNCTSTCQSNWDGQITICTEASIAK